MAEDFSINELWKAATATLFSDPRISPQLHGFVNLAEPKGIMAGILYLEVPNDLTRDMFEQQLRASLLAALGAQDEGPEIANFAIVVNPEMEEYDTQQPHYMNESEATTNSQASGSPEVQVQDTASNESKINPKYTFDNFVIGPSNRLTHAAAVAVAEAPAKSFNPLFIYGDSGLGKTHLLHAIGHYSQSLYPGIRVRYVSSEEFTNDYINSVRDNRMVAFMARYREVDILLIDDIQFLQGKIETQETFFHTFNNLHEHNKQVVITSDLQPKLLTGFEDRMRTRFQWGLITDVQTPDLETRIAILRKKAQNDNLQVPDDVLEYIASKIYSNIRELEGTLIRVTAWASLNRQAIDIDLVQVVLKDMIALEEDRHISPTDIIDITAKYYKLSVDDLYGSSRSQTIALARQIAMYLCRELTSLSLPKIGQLFGNRDHTTVMYANKKIETWMKERRSIYSTVTDLTNQIRDNNR